MKQISTFSRNFKIIFRSVESEKKPVHNILEPYNVLLQIQITTSRLDLDIWYNKLYIWVAIVDRNKTLATANSTQKHISEFPSPAQFTQFLYIFPNILSCILEVFRYNKVSLDIKVIKELTLKAILEHKDNSSPTPIYQFKNN